MILDVLKKYNVKATFFIIGQNIDGNERILKRIHDEGHEIGNHTFSHRSLYKLTDEEIINEIRKCEEEIYKITGVNTKLFRPPEGYINDNIASMAKGLDKKVILWKVDTYDWKGKSASEIEKNVSSNLKCGDIILMHDYIWRKSYTAESLDILIPKLTANGYRFASISELIEE